MTINQMFYFSSVCTFRNITRSSKALSISQPALSGSLADLEAEVGFKLLNRTSTGVYPTAEGARFLVHVDSVLARYNLLQKDLPAIAESQRTIKVGFRPYASESEMLRLCKEFKAVDGECRFFYNEIMNKSPYLFLDEGQIDFLATTARLLPEDWKEKYEFCVLAEIEPVRLTCHKDNPLAAKEKVGVEDLDGVPIVFWERHSEVLDRLREIMDEQGLTLNHVATMPQMSGMVNMICNDMAVGMLDGDFVDHIDVLHHCPLKDNLSSVFLSDGKIKIYLVWKKISEKYENMKKFARFARKREDT